MWSKAARLTRSLVTSVHISLGFSRGGAGGAGGYGGGIGTIRRSLFALLLLISSESSKFSRSRFSWFLDFERARDGAPTERARERVSLMSISWSLEELL